MVKQSRVRLIPSIVLLFGLFSFFVQKVWSQEILTNEAIAKMVKAQLSDEIVVRMIKMNPADFSLTSDALIELRQQGLSDIVLSAMLDKESDLQPTAPRYETDRSGRSPSNAVLKFFHKKDTDKKEPEKIDKKESEKKENELTAKAEDPAGKAASATGGGSFDGGCRGIDTRTLNGVSAIELGHCRFNKISLKMLINLAYDFRIMPGKLNETMVGGPDWVDTDRFEVDAQAADASATEKQLRQTLQTFLKNRFRLEFHYENRNGFGSGLFVIDHVEKPAMN